MTDFQQSIARFVESARDYCAWVEGAAGPSDAFDAQRLVSRLHSDAVSLPEVDGGREPPGEHFPDGSLAEWKIAVQRFSALPLQHYWEIFDPLTQESEEPVTGDLADDLADIYLDVKRGLLAHDMGYEQHAVWYWRLNWTIHWGEHATSAMRALYWLERNRE